MKKCSNPLKKTKLKPQRDTTKHSLNGQKTKLTVPSVGREVEQQEPRYTADRNVNWFSNFKT